MPLSGLRIDSARLSSRLEALGAVGATDDGGVARLALTDEDRAGRDLVVSWMKQAGLATQIDEIGNIFGLREGSSNHRPVMSGSHVDTVHNGGKYDGAYGVLAALEVIETLGDHGITTENPLAVAVFTNEEGARFQPDMMGSLGHAGGMPVESVLDSLDRHGVSIRSELARIGYAGDVTCGSLRPEAFVELHIEQGPVLEQAGITIGAVEHLQGISWTEIHLRGQANHAGTTPMHLRHDAGYCAGAVTHYLRVLTREMGGDQVATSGTVEFKPNVINVVPGEARMTVDLRNTNAAALLEAERRLQAFLCKLEVDEGVDISTSRLARFDPVQFDHGIVNVIEQKAAQLGLSCRRMASGAGHDAQMMARVCPTAMIFVPSEGGVSHSPAEYTETHHLEAGANVLLQTMLELGVGRLGC